MSLVHFMFKVISKLFFDSLLKKDPQYMGPKLAYLVQILFLWYKKEYKQTELSPSSYSRCKYITYEFQNLVSSNILACQLLKLTWTLIWTISVFQFSSVTQSCPTLCNPMDCITPGFPVHHQLLEFAQLLSLMSVMPSNHLILCCPLLLQPSIFPSIRVFSSESLLCIRWPKII